MAKKWYIVHVYSGFENKVKASLEEKIASSPNPDKFDEVLVPTEEVVEMREKMRDNLDKSSDDTFDVKQGRGGITDIEFMVQYLLLRYSSDYPTLCHYSDNIRQLEALGYIEER